MTTQTSSVATVTMSQTQRRKMPIKRLERTRKAYDEPREVGDSQAKRDDRVEHPSRPSVHDTDRDERNERRRKVPR